LEWDGSPQFVRLDHVSMLIVAAFILLAGASMVWLVIKFGVRMQQWTEGKGATGTKA